MPNDGTITSVTFLADGDVFATRNAAPYTATTSFDRPGTFPIQVIARDNAGNTTTVATTVTITGTALTTPTVRLTLPAGSQTVYAGQRFVFEATVTAGNSASFISRSIFSLTDRLWVR